jgi:hypothetical protein
MAEAHITQVTGQKPIGFRGPGFSCSQATLQVLARRGYLYDASTFPTFLGPLARAYYFMTTKLTPAEKAERKKLFGTLGDGLRSIYPYRWRIDTGSPQAELIEIPVTTMPFFKVPIHVSYILYLSVFSPTMALFYFRMFLELCRLFKVQPSLLLHPLDFLGVDDVQELSFFPAMQLPSEKKLWIVSEVLRLFSGRFTVVPMQQHARELEETTRFPLIKPNFAH